MRSRYTYILFVSFLFLGCHLFESTKVPKKEIKSASSWSEKDQGPNFSECDDFENDQEKKDCFESIISNSILDYLDENPLESSEFISEEIGISGKCQTCEEQEYEDWEDETEDEW